MKRRIMLVKVVALMIRWQSFLNLEQPGEKKGRPVLNLRFLKKFWHHWSKASQIRHGDITANISVSFFKVTLISSHLALKSSFLLVLRSKDEERAGLWHRDGFLFQLQISHWARSGTFWDRRVLLLIITWWPERQPVDPIWAVAHRPRMEGGYLPGKSAGGNGSLISLTLDSNSSILSCRWKTEEDVKLGIWTCVLSSHLYLSSCWNALDPFGSLLCQLLCQKSFLFCGLVRNVWPAGTKRFP